MTQLTQEDGGRIDEKLNTNADPLAFTATHAAPHDATNDGVAALLEAQGLDDGFDALLLLRSGHVLGKPQHGRKVKRLKDSEGLVENFVCMNEEASGFAGLPLVSLIRCSQIFKS